MELLAGGFDVPCNSSLPPCLLFQPHLLRSGLQLLHQLLNPSASLVHAGPKTRHAPTVRVFLTKAAQIAIQGLFSSGVFLGYLD